MQTATVQTLDRFFPLSAPIFGKRAASQKVLALSCDPLFCKVLLSKSEDLNLELWICNSVESFLASCKDSNFDFCIVDLCGQNLKTLLESLEADVLVPIVFVANSPRQLRLAEWSSNFKENVCFMERAKGAFRILEKGIEMAGVSRNREDRFHFAS